MQVDEELKVWFKIRPNEFWFEANTEVPNLWAQSQIYITAFPTTYLVEKGFSRVTQILTKQPNRL